MTHGVFENWSAGVSIPTFRQEEASVGKRLELSQTQCAWLPTQNVNRGKTKQLRTTPFLNSVLLKRLRGLGDGRERKEATKVSLTSRHRVRLDSNAFLAFTGGGNPLIELPNSLKYHEAFSGETRMYRELLAMGKG